MRFSLLKLFLDIDCVEAWCSWTRFLRNNDFFMRHGISNSPQHNRLCLGNLGRTMNYRRNLKSSGTKFTIDVAVTLSRSGQSAARRHSLYRSIVSTQPLVSSCSFFHPRKNSVTCFLPANLNNLRKIALDVQLINHRIFCLRIKQQIEDAHKIFGDCRRLPPKKKIHSPTTSRARTVRRTGG